MHPASLSLRAATQSPATSLALLLAVFANGSAFAANWELAPRVEGGYMYNDNYRLDLPGNEIDVSGIEADAQVSFRTVDPRTKFAITPRVRSTYFPDEREEDSNDYFLGALFEDVTPRSRARVAADFSREDVVRSELPSADVVADLGVADAVDAGRTLLRNRRDLIQFLPHYSYDFSQRYRMELDAHYTDADFDRNLVNAQQDFREYGVAAGAGYLVSPRSAIMFRGRAKKYDTVIDADSYGAELQWDHDFTPESRMYVRLGGQQTDVDNGQSETNVIAGIGGRWSSPRNQLFLDFTRNVNAASAGTIVERHQLRLRINHDVSPRVSLLLGLRAFRDEAIEESSSYATRKYAAAETGVEWRWSRSFSLRTTYDYIWQEYDDEPSDASSNGFLISLVYEPKRAD